MKQLNEKSVHFISEQTLVLILTKVGNINKKLWSIPVGHEVGRYIKATPNLVHRYARVDVRHRSENCLICSLRNLSDNQLQYGPQINIIHYKISNYFILQS